MGSRPSLRRLIAALVVAPFAGSLAVYLAWAAITREPGFGLFLAGYALLGGYALELLIALPVYLWLRGRLRFTCWRAIASGALIAGAPFIALALVAFIANPPGHQTFALAAGLAILAGGVGGAAFWLLTRPTAQAGSKRV